MTDVSRDPKVMRRRKIPSANINIDRNIISNSATNLFTQLCSSPADAWPENLAMVFILSMGAKGDGCQGGTRFVPIPHVNRRHRDKPPPPKKKWRNNKRIEFGKRPSFVLHRRPVTNRIFKFDRLLDRAAAFSLFERLHDGDQTLLLILLHKYSFFIIILLY